MYNRDFGGIKSEGQLYNYEREYNRARDQNDEYGRPREEERNSPEPCEPPHERERKKGLRLDFLRDMKLDDLILIGIGLLLLLDSDGENDMFALLIAFLLIF